MSKPARRCRCGHSRSAHEHYTVPGDLRCGLCGCPRWHLSILSILAALVPERRADGASPASRFFTLDNTTLGRLNSNALTF